MTVVAKAMIIDAKQAAQAEKKASNDANWDREEQGFRNAKKIKKSNALEALLHWRMGVFQQPAKSVPLEKEKLIEYIRSQGSAARRNRR